LTLKRRRDRFKFKRIATLDAPISATAILAEIAEGLVRLALADRPDEKIVSLLAISLSQLEQHFKLQLELPLGLEDEKRRPGSPRGIARWTADRAIDLIRDRFGWDAVGYDQSCWDYPAPYPTSFASSPKRTFEPSQSSQPMSGFGGATDIADLVPKTRLFFKPRRVKTTP
jgi:hypothetical protein